MQKNYKFNDEYYNIIGSNIKKIRKLRKITQEQLVARLQVQGHKLSRSDISKTENGKRFISDFEVIGFARALRVTLDELFKDIDDKYNIS